MVFARCWWEGGGQDKDSALLGLASATLLLSLYLLEPTTFLAPCPPPLGRGKLSVHCKYCLPLPTEYHPPPNHAPTQVLTSRTKIIGPW